MFEWQEMRPNLQDLHSSSLRNNLLLLMLFNTMELPLVVVLLKSITLIMPLSNHNPNQYWLTLLYLRFLQLSLLKTLKKLSKESKKHNLKSLHKSILLMRQKRHHEIGMTVGIDQGIGAVLGQGEGVHHGTVEDLDQGKEYVLEGLAQGTETGREDRLIEDGLTQRKERGYHGLDPDRGSGTVGGIEGLQLLIGEKKEIETENEGDLQIDEATEISQENVIEVVNEILGQQKYLQDEEAGPSAVLQNQENIENQKILQRMTTHLRVLNLNSSLEMILREIHQNTDRRHLPLQTIP